MTTTAASIIRRAANILQDETLVRWSARELVQALNDAQREVIIPRPDATSTTAIATLVAGSRQTLDAMALSPAPSKLIEITRNLAAASTKKAVCLVSRNLLDAQTPGWHSLAGTVDIMHYMVDARDPKTFYVYPPALATAQLEILYSGLPTDIAEPALGATFSGVVGNLSLPDIYANAVLDYVLYRAFSKDAEFAGTAARAQAHYAAFANALGMEIKATLAVQPQAKPGAATPNALG